MEKQYQLLYKEADQVKTMHLRAVSAEMAKKFFSLIRPDCEVVEIINK